MDQISKLLEQQRAKLSTNKDFGVKIELSQNNRILPLNNINEIVDVGKRFDTERERSTCYRLLGTIRCLFTNVLVNIDGPDSLDDPFTTLRDTDPAEAGLELTLQESYDENLIEEDGWFGYINSNCDYVDLNPKRDKFIIVPQSGIKNWELLITYPESTDNTLYVINGGINLINTQVADVGSRNMVGFLTAIRHGLSVGDRVMISGLTANNGEWEVMRLGDDTGNDKDIIFVVDMPTMPGILNGRMVRMVDGTPSEYYARKFKMISNFDDYDVYPVAFAQGLYKDKTFQFSFNEDISVDGLRDNLNRPISELYLSMIKVSNDGTWGNVMSGLDIPFINGLPTSIPDIRRIPINNNINIVNTTDPWFYGDIVEYNKKELEEKVLSDVMHRVNTSHRESKSRQEGYFYKPHHKIKIRAFSKYIEQGDVNTYDLPIYSEDLGDGRFIWKDMLTIGYMEDGNNGVDYPFLNGCHYIHQNYSLNFRRQDPLGTYGLKHPSDFYGVYFNPDKYIVNKNDNDC